MEHLKKNKNRILAVLCLLLLLTVGLIYTNGYQKLPMFHRKSITVGVFSDSYWEVQNGYY